MVRRACRAISGVLNEGMRRDEGYEFMVVGRMLERSLFTVGLPAAVPACFGPRASLPKTRQPSGPVSSSSEPRPRPEPEINPDPMGRD